MTSNLMDIPFNPAASKDVVLHTRVVSDTGGGPEKTILLSSPFLANSDYALAAAYMHPPDDPGFEVIRERAAHWNSPLISVPDRGATDIRVLRQLLRLCKQYNVKIWHAHDYKSNLFGLLIRPFHRMKLVTTVHGWVVQTSKTPLYYKIDKLCLPRYHHVICVSDNLLDEVAKLKIRSDRLTYIPNAIDDASQSREGPSSAAAMRRQRAVPNERVLIGASGRLMPEKSFDLLIRATKALLSEGFDVELWIAGEGAARPDLERMIVELGLADRVKLIGFCSDMKAFYESLDLFVLSSQREGLPNVILEAAAMGVPIVSTRVAGVPKMLTDDRDGLLCDVGDLEGLTDAMRRLVSDPAKRDHIAVAARKLVEEQYSFRKRMDRVQAIYDQLFGKPG